MLVTARPQSQSALALVWRASERLLRQVATVVTLMVTALSALGAQATGRATLTGVTKDIATGAPVPGVTVKVTGLSTQVLSDDRGVYRITNLPLGGSVTVQATRLGYGMRQIENVSLDREVVTLDIQVNQNALALDAVTSSATIDPTTGVRMPMAVTRIDADQISVPNLSNAALSIQGRVAGVTITPYSGAPGDSANVQIRSLLSPFRDNAPLYVVDGVPLVGTTNTTSDFLGMDIESVEVIRGAAAASLYGSRASAGVIAITTKRGKDVGVNEAKIEVRQDFQRDDTDSNLPPRRKGTRMKQNELQQWISNSGSVTTTAGRTQEFFAVQDNLYPYTYDNLHQVFVGNKSMNSRVAISQATATTNLNVSFTRVRNPGQFRFNQGLTQQNVRFYVNHQLRDNLTIDASVNHQRSNLRRNSPSTSFSSIFTKEPNINFFTPNTDPRTPDFPYAQFPDSASTSQSPLWLEFRYNDYDNRQRNTISTQMAYRPFNWLTVRGDFGYDKSDNFTNEWTPRGQPTGTSATSVGTGLLRYGNSNTDGFNADLTTSALRDFGRLTTNLSLRAHAERQRALSFSGSSTPVGLGFQTITGGGSQSGSSSTSETRSNAFSVNGKADYAGKYILDALVLSEGNSRFGPEERWQTFWRAAGSWLLSEEAWYPSMLSRLSLAKLRASYGLAGGAPGFSDQFEQVQVNNATGSFFRNTLGNPLLAPEIRKELELGTDLIYNNKISVQFTYSRATLKDAITPSVAPVVSGYDSYQLNIGESRGETWELTIEGTVPGIPDKLFNQRFQWRTNMVFDRSRSTIVDLGTPCFGFNTVHPTCEDTPITAIYGLTTMRSFDDLTSQAPSYKPYRDWWEVNDDGILVPVGPGNHYWEGISKGLWGTALSFHVGEPAGFTVFKGDWGVPQFQKADTIGGAQARYWKKLADTQQWFNIGLNNSFDIGNVRADVDLRGALGGDIWNTYYPTMLTNFLHPTVDQWYKADSLKKPVYYYNGSAPGEGDGFSGLDIPNSQFAYSEHIIKSPKTNWLKVSGVRLSYSMNNRQYPFLNRLGASRVSLQGTASNLWTWKHSEYNGLDPETGGNRTAGGSFRTDTFRYPQPRRYSGIVTVVF